MFWWMDGDDNGCGGGSGSGSGKNQFDDTSFANIIRLAPYQTKRTQSSKPAL